MVHASASAIILPILEHARITRHPHAAEGARVGHCAEYHGAGERGLQLKFVLPARQAMMTRGMLNARFHFIEMTGAADWLPLLMFASLK